MKNTIYCLTTLIAIFVLSLKVVSQDHVQPAHQQIVREAWNLLKASDPEFYNNFEMNYWVGTYENDGPWSFYNQGRIVAGAWREDEEDVVYNYWCWFNRTGTHFWEAKDPYTPTGTYTLEEECLGITWSCSPPANAWHRLEKYILGGWELKKQYPGLKVDFQRWDGQGIYTITSYGPIGLMYEGLVEGWRNLYHTGYMKITGYYQLNGEWVTYDPPLEVKLTDSQKYFCYEILGRMAHCIGDMSVPAHTHLDAHPDPFPCSKGDFRPRRVSCQGTLRRLKHFVLQRI